MLTPMLALAGTVEDLKSLKIDAKKSKTQVNKVENDTIDGNLTLSTKDNSKFEIKIDSGENKLFETLGPMAVSIASSLVTILVVCIASRNSREIAIKQIEQQRSIAKDSYNADIISKSRHKWINNLRDETASLIGDCSHLHIALTGEGNNEDKQANLASQILFSANKVELLLNKDKANHQRVVRAIGKLRSNITGDANEYFQLTQELVISTQSVIKEVWEKVKEGESL